MVISMSLEMTIDFPGNMRVDATVGDTVVHTDQSVKVGGDGSAPEPYLLFLASIGTCAGVYVRAFCAKRNIPTDGIRIVQRMDWADGGGPLARIDLDIQVPPGFPDRYHRALARAADQCAVKKTIAAPPEILTRTTVAAGDGVP